MLFARLYYYCYWNSYQSPLKFYLLFPKTCIFHKVIHITYLYSVCKRFNGKDKSIFMLYDKLEIDPD